MSDEEQYTPEQLEECARIASEALEAAAEKLFAPVATGQGGPP